MSKSGVLVFLVLPVALVVGFLGLRGGFTIEGIVSGLVPLSPDQLGSFLSGTFGVAAFVTVIYQITAAERGLGAQVQNMAEQLKVMAHQLELQCEAVRLAREAHVMEFMAAAYHAYERVVAQVTPLVDEWMQDLEGIGIVKAEEKINCKDSVEGKMFLVAIKFSRRDARFNGSVLKDYILQPYVQQSFRYFIAVTEAFEQFCGSATDAKSVRNMYNALHFPEIRSALKGLDRTANGLPANAANDTRALWRTRRS